MTNNKISSVTEYLLKMDEMDMKKHTELLEKIDELEDKLIIYRRNDLKAFEGRIFTSEEELREKIKKIFTLREDTPDIGLIQNEGFDDELCFFDDYYCYSIYLMRGASGRVFVCETSCQRD